ncbi:MAG: hypothetical protein LWY06_00110 [Firmicutes bacterium]|nr:hypothetical protein [Bacillota bacterium]
MLDSFSKTSKHTHKGLGIAVLYSVAVLSALAACSDGLLFFTIGFAILFSVFGLLLTIRKFGKTVNNARVSYFSAAAASDSQIPGCPCFYIAFIDLAEDLGKVKPGLKWLYLVPFIVLGFLGGAGMLFSVYINYLNQAVGLIILQICACLVMFMVMNNSGSFFSKRTKPYTVLIVIVTIVLLGLRMLSIDQGETVLLLFLPAVVSHFI